MICICTLLQALYALFWSPCHSLFTCIELWIMQMPPLPTTCMVNQISITTNSYIIMLAGIIEKGFFDWLRRSILAWGLISQEMMNLPQSPNQQLWFTHCGFIYMYDDVIQAGDCVLTLNVITGLLKKANIHQ